MIMLDLEALSQAIGDLNETKVLALLNDFVATNPDREQTQQVVNACQRGMTLVGDLYETGEYFVGDLIFAGELLNNAINILKPIIGGESNSKVGTIILGTVQGDLHDIGKNIFKSMIEAAGFEAYDLGHDVSPSAFVEMVRKVKPQVVGMSGVLTLALDSMKAVIAELVSAGLRDSVKIIIGGNPVSKVACEQIGADAFTTNAAEGVKLCQGWVR